MHGFKANAIRKLAVSAALCLAAGAAWSPAAAQSTFGTHVLLLSPAVRSSGMGETGAADAADPLNSFYNPAVAPAAGEIFFAGIYSPLLRGLSDDFRGSNLVDDVRGAQAFVGAGFSFGAGNAIGLRAGGSLAYTRLDYGDFFFNDCPSCTWELPPGPGLEQALSIAAGLEASYRERLRLGAGFAVKPFWLQPEPYPWHGEVDEQSKVVYDLGFLLSGDILKRAGLRLAASAGFSILNMGGDVEIATAFDRAVIDRSYRAGFGLRLEGPSATFLGRETVLGALSVNLDTSGRDRDEFARANGDYWGAGVETAILEMLFVRFGYLDKRLFELADSESHAADYTFGVGIGLTANGCRVRLDYATVPQPVGLENADKFGLSCGVAF